MNNKMFININTNPPSFPYTIEQLLADNPNTSFPSDIPEERLAEWGVYPVVRTQPPSYNEITHIHEQATAQFNQETNQWETVWSVRPHTEAETSEKAAGVRIERNAKLAATDWTQLSDAPVDKTTWAAYRQELRDITTQSGFPWGVIWPQEP